ncbi:MAG: DNA polymerase III subunit alpha [Clostridia bacterium BRH_c25]|nr:MAG: DNA polymerase III subunit alpha [Clostridia bacterium BRH_c25]
MQSGTKLDSEIFLEYKDKFELKKIRVMKKAKEWELIISLKGLISIFELNKIEEQLSKHYGLKKVRIVIEESSVRMGADEFVKSHWEDLKKVIVTNNPSFTGFLMDSLIQLDNDKIKLMVTSKEAEGYLISKKCHGIVSQYIKDYFNIDSQVLICFNEEEKLCSEEYLKCYFEEETKMVAEAMKTCKNDSGKNKAKERKDAVIMGRPFNDIPISIATIAEDSGRVTIQGSIFNTEVKVLNNGKTIIIFNITDNTNSITAKIFIKEENDTAKLVENITNGRYVRIKGDIQYDQYIKELVIFPNNILEAEKTVRLDDSEEKRIELHAHTGMSSMDGICSATDLIMRAKTWGHKAIAITDHGVVQAYPEAYEASKKHGVKVIYGVEAYFVNDGVPIVYNYGSRSFDDEFIVFDIETTGLSSINDRITEIGAVRIRQGQLVDKFSELINPEMLIPDNITKLTGITNAMVKDKGTIKDILPKFLEFAGDSPLIAHNASFDCGFIRAKARELGLEISNIIIDTLQLSRTLLPQLKRHKLNLVCEYLGINLENHHRASDDAEATAEMMLKFIEIMKEKGIKDILEMNNLSAAEGSYKTHESFHIILLVKNMTGLRNLYKLISMAHLDFFYKKPRIPKSLLMQYREGLIIGSACEAGELYRSILNNSDDNTITDIARFYDYLEIQPNGNNEFLLRNGKLPNKDMLEAINRKIVELGRKLNKLVVATGDVHFLEPEDEVYRRIIMAGQGYSDADEQAPLYFKSTGEMLEEFKYLGKTTAYDVVVRNSNRILEQIGDIVPIPEETYPPKIEGAEEQIREMTMKKVYELYGEKLPEVVEKRLEKELNSIINNGYAVLYLIAQKLVAKSLSDGYLVGSRGSVGSSFVATMCDITEVNPLPPHYLCPSCKYSHFILDGSIESGADLSEKNCPECGTALRKEGHDIPFEMFLGFDGDKEPDIDLNFAGEYQPEAHKYTEELFGKGYVFRAGTIGTIADKTAYGFIKKYYEAKGIKVNSAEMNRLIQGCTGIKRTTGQHPGGVMIVPNYTDIYNFTPIQRPADDTGSSITTTHFDYHSISGRLLKLDILGHDVPSIIRMLEDITGFGVNNIPLDDPKTMSLFTSTEALNVNLDEIDCKVGSLGIPEFGTKFVRQMLMDTQPKTFAELVRISGLSHGTDVWLNNAQDLIRSGTATLKEVISTRDDIMLFLIYKGVQPKTSFKIAENVRKGKGLTPEYEEAMREQSIPEWYIQSCKTVKYLFPKAHATAYVMMSFRIAYYKVYYPEAFYATYFTVKLDDFDADLLTKGIDSVKAKWIEIDRLGNNATTKEKNLMTLLESVYEMYTRGIKLLPVDLYQSDADKFLVTEKGILPPLGSLQGVGASAAQNIVNTRQGSSFISMDDLRERAKVSKTVIEILKNHGCLKGLPESNQLSLFSDGGGLEA